MDHLGRNNRRGAPHPRAHTKARATGLQVLDQLSTSSNFLPVHHGSSHRARQANYALQQQAKTYGGMRFDSEATNTHMASGPMADSLHYKTSNVRAAPGMTSTSSSNHHRASMNTASTPCPVTGHHRLLSGDGAHSLPENDRNVVPRTTLPEDRWRNGTSSRRRGSGEQQGGPSSRRRGSNEQQGGCFVLGSALRWSDLQFSSNAYSIAAGGRRASNQEMRTGATGLTNVSHVTSSAVERHMMSEHGSHPERRRGSNSHQRGSGNSKSYQFSNPFYGLSQRRGSGNHLRIDAHVSDGNSSSSAIRPTEITGMDSINTSTITQSHSRRHLISNHKRSSRTLTRDPFASATRDPMASISRTPSGPQEACDTRDSQSIISPNSYAQMHLSKIANGSKPSSPQPLPRGQASVSHLDVSASQVPPPQKLAGELAQEFAYANCERVETPSSVATRIRLSTAPASKTRDQYRAELPLGPNFPELSEKVFEDSSSSNHSRTSRRGSQFSTISTNSSKESSIASIPHSLLGIASHRSRASYPVSSVPHTPSKIKSHSLSPHKHTSQPYSAGDTHRSFPLPSSAGSPVHNLTLLKQRSVRHPPRRHLNTAPSLRAYTSSPTHTGSPERHRFPFSRPDTTVSAPSSPVKNASQQRRAHEHTRLLHSSQSSRPHTTMPTAGPSREDLPATANARSYPYACARSDDALLPSDQRRSASPGVHDPFATRQPLCRTPPRPSATAPQSMSATRQPLIRTATAPQRSSATRQPLDRTPPRPSATPPRNMLRRVHTQVPPRMMHAQKARRARLESRPFSGEASSGPDPTFSPTAGGNFRNNPAHLESITSEWFKTLSVSTTGAGDSDWQACMECLTNIRKLIRSPDVPKETSFKLVAKFRGPLVMQVGGLRSTLVKSVCGTLAEIFEVFGDKYARTAGLYLSPLFKQLQATGALAGPAHQCILAMIAHVRFPFLIEFLTERAATAKAEVLRVRATQYLNAIVLNTEWRRVVHFRDSGRMRDFVSFVVKQTNDCKDKVRKHARKLAVDFARAFPQTASDLFSRTNTRTQRLLVKESPQAFGAYFAGESAQHVLAGKLSRQVSEMTASSLGSYESSSLSSSCFDTLSRTQQFPKRKHSIASEPKARGNNLSKISRSRWSSTQSLPPR